MFLPILLLDTKFITSKVSPYFGTLIYTFSDNIKSGGLVIVEFAGLPRSGKSSCLDIAQSYYSRKGVSVKLVGEGARFCPFNDRNRTEFSVWMANRALNGILEGRLSREPILLVQDRGLFDALAFINLLYCEELIDKEMYVNSMGYLANPLWTNSVDLVLLFLVSTERALKRDIPNKLGAGEGVITNPKMIERLRMSYDFLLKEYGNRFPRIEVIDTSNLSIKETSHLVIRLIQSSISSSNINNNERGGLSSNN